MTVEDNSGNPVPACCRHEADAAHALFAAIAQIGLALRESQDPVTELGTLFARLSETVAAARAAASAPASNGHAGHQTAPASAATVDTLVQKLQADVFKGIQQLQFYDRLVQHLSHLQDYLICVANELDLTRSRPQTQETWDAMHAKLRKRLISDEQRGLLDLFLTPQTATRVSAQAERPDYSAPGSFEMF